MRLDLAKRKTVVRAIALLIMTAGLSYCSAQSKPEFVTTHGTAFRAGGQLFRFGGANSFQLPWLTADMLNSTLGDAEALNFRVIRTFASVLIGDRSQENVDADWFSPGDFQKGESNHVSFQSWNATTGQMVINDGPNGLPHLDAMLAAAASHHIRLVVALVDNWNYYGGTVEYCAWRHLPIVYLAHSRQAWCPDFYTDLKVRDDFKRWTTTLLTRRNTITGVMYKDDPTIMAWELVNEPLADTRVLTPWAADMAHLIHKIDRRHLITIGDVGFRRTPAEFTQLLKIRHISYGTLHMYPVYRQPAATPQACLQILKRYIALGKATRRPVVLEEFGWSKVHQNQAAVYGEWTNAVLDSGGAGWQFWVFCGQKGDGSPPKEDPEGFDIYKDGSAVTEALSGAARKSESSTYLPKPVGSDL